MIIKKLPLLLSLLLAVGMLSVGCTTELDRCMDRQADLMFGSSLKHLKKYERRGELTPSGKQTLRIIERECNKQGIY